MALPPLSPRTYCRLVSHAAPCCEWFALTLRSLPVQLSLYDVVVFIDDSGSMLEGSKWRDLQAIVQQIVEITTQFDTDGIQVACTHLYMRACFKSF